MRKHLSPVANRLLQRSAEILGTSEDALVEEFESDPRPELSDYSRKLVEFCSSKTLVRISSHLDKEITEGSFSRLTFDMMLAWENPSYVDEPYSYSENVAKEREDLRSSVKVDTALQQQDDVSLFYSDIMPLLVDDKESVGEDAFVWLGSLVPLANDVVNGRFAFEALTATTANRLHFPAHDVFLKEIDKCTKYLQKQAAPGGVVLRDDEFILHVEGTASTQRVVRHIGASSWPGRLTLTNYALYFEASGVISFEDALKVDLSRTDTDQKVAAASTGPWGAPLFDKAMIYDSPQLPESLVLEFPEMTCSTRRDLWLTLTREIILMHKFLDKFKIESPVQTWEMHSRTMLGILRLHAAREMLRICVPVPNNFLIFSLFDELPKGDYVLEGLSSGLKQMSYIHPCSAASILKSLDVPHPSLSDMEHPTSVEHAEKLDEHLSDQSSIVTSLETTITLVREEAKEIGIAEASVEGLKEGGIIDSVLILLELVGPLKNVLPSIQEILIWRRPVLSSLSFTLAMIIIYKEWVGYLIATILLSVVAMMLWAKYSRLCDRCVEMEVNTSSDKTTMESIVDAQYGLKSFHAWVQMTNITILKIRSILVSKAPKQTNLVMLVMVGVALVLMVVPFKFVLMGAVIHIAVMNSRLGECLRNEQGERRWREWWNSIPVVPVRTVEKTS